jgi:hypothetical protein
VPLLSLIDSWGRSNRNTIGRLPLLLAVSIESLAPLRNWMLSIQIKHGWLVLPLQSCSACRLMAVTTPLTRLTVLVVSPLLQLLSVSPRVQIASPV